MMLHKTRESWLRAAVDYMRPWISEHGSKVPDNIYVGCGWVKGHKDQGIGVCYDGTCSDDGAPQMWICPTQNDPHRVIDILLHEMIHAALGCDAGHGKEFKKLMRGVGLEGKATATIVTHGTELYNKIDVLVNKLGPYPHSAVRAPAKKKGKGGSGWVRLKSVNDEDYKVVISPKIMEEHGRPKDPWGDDMIGIDEEAPGEDDGGEE